MVKMKCNIFFNNKCGFTSFFSLSGDDSFGIDIELIENVMKTRFKDYSDFQTCGISIFQDSIVMLQNFKEKPVHYHFQEIIPKTIKSKCEIKNCKTFGEYFEKNYGKKIESKETYLIKVSRFYDKVKPNYEDKSCSFETEKKKSSKLTDSDSLKEVSNVFAEEIKAPDPARILEALTSKCAKDIFNSEKLKIIGNLYIRYFVTVQLYNLNPQADENSYIICEAVF